MKKKLVIVSVSLILLSSIVLLSMYIVSREREREFERRLNYASWLDLTHSESDSRAMSVLTAEYFNRTSPDRVQYTEIVFVHSPEEAAQFDEYVLAV